MLVVAAVRRYGEVEQGVVVYLATDSQFIVKHVMEVNGGRIGDLSFAAAGYGVDGAPQPPRDVWMKGSRGWGSKNALGVISDALLLSHCEHLVGTHTSAVSKVAYLMMYARLGEEAQVGFFPFFCDFQ